MWSPLWRRKLPETTLTSQRAKICIALILMAILGITKCQILPGPDRREDCRGSSIAGAGSHQAGGRASDPGGRQASGRDADPRAGGSSASASGSGG